MLMSRRKLLSSLFLVMADLALASCSKAPALPTLEPAKTPKPTFTPGTSNVEPAEASGPTASPTITHVATQTKIAPTSTPLPPTITPTPVRTPKPLAMSSPEYGMHAFPWWRPEVASRDFGVIRDAGFGWVKVNFGWRDIEGAGKGQFTWSRADKVAKAAQNAGLDVVVRVDNQPQWAGGGFPLNGPPDNMQDYIDFMHALTKRYKGRFRAYEVWNEPNLSREWGGKLPDPGAYVKMLGAAYEAIKAEDPNAMVISAGLSPTGSWTEVSRPDDWYLKSMYIAMGGKSTGYFDVYGAHGAGYKVSPETDPAAVAADKELGGDRSMCFRRVEDLRAIMVENGDQDKQIALLEFGWTSDPRPDSPYYWHRVSEETKADYLVRAYQYAKKNWSPWIGLMSLIYISDPDWTRDNEQYWWAISDPGWPEFKPRPAYDALKAMPK